VGIGRRTVQNAGDFTKHRSNPLSSLRDLNVEKLLYCERVAELVRHCGISEVRILLVVMIDALMDT
jgi:hypothetical protein